MWKICVENARGKVVDELKFTKFRKAREVFDALVLQDFAKAALIREDGTLLEIKTR